MTCPYRIRKELDKFSEALRKIRDGELIHSKIYHREGDHWWIENVVYEKDSDGNLVRKT